MREWPAVADQAHSAESPSFDARSLAVAAGGQVLRGGSRPIRGGTVDSRRVEPGNCFFALPGERTDGHRFVLEAAANGAAALVVARSPTAAEMARLGELPDGGPTVVGVPDTLLALHAAAAAWRARFDPLVVGITGSLAKTSTKEQVAEVLSERWQVLRSRANENTEIGLPLTLLRLDPSHAAAVLEMGMYVPGDIAVLARLAQPTIGVVTAVRGTHVSRAGSIEAIERGKRELIDALPAGGTAVLNADDPRVANMAAAREAELEVLRYGFAAAADVTAHDIVSRAAAGMSFTLRAHGDEVEVVSPALGRHSVHNALAAAAVGRAAGMSLPEIAAGLARPFSVPQRTVLLQAGEWQLIDDTYNAGPDSMRAALDLLASLPGRHVAVLGEMLELGADSDAAHQTIGEYAAGRADLVIAVGPMAEQYEIGAARAPDAGFVPFETREQALRELHLSLRPGDVVLVKASRGAELDLLVDELRRTASAEPVA